MALFHIIRSVFVLFIYFFKCYLLIFYRFKKRKQTSKRMLFRLLINRRIFFDNNGSTDSIFFEWNAIVYAAWVFSIYDTNAILLSPSEVFFFFFFSGWGEEAQTVICNLSLHFTDLAESFGINLKLCIAYIENDMAYQFHSLWRFYFTCRVWKQNKKILNRLRRESHGSM